MAWFSSHDLNARPFMILKVWGNEKLSSVLWTSIPEQDQCMPKGSSLHILWTKETLSDFYLFVILKVPNNLNVNEQLKSRIKNTLSVN